MHIPQTFALSIWIFCFYGLQGPSEILRSFNVNKEQHQNNVAVHYCKKIYILRLRAEIWPLEKEGILWWSIDQNASMILFAFILKSKDFNMDIFGKHKEQ